jgi:5,10-methylenetetrahydromethanopterin reductase
MPQPFRIGVMQLTMEPVDEMLATACALDEHGFDTIWLAEAYPWWRKHQMEARSSTVVSALMAQATERLTIAWGIISPFTRHPVQVAMDARVVQELAPARSSSASGRRRSSSTTPSCRRTRRSGRCATPWRSCAACFR